MRDYASKIKDAVLDAFESKQLGDLDGKSTINTNNNLLSFLIPTSSDQHNRTVRDVIESNTILSDSYTNIKNRLSQSIDQEFISETNTLTSIATKLKTSLEQNVNLRIAKISSGSDVNITINRLKLGGMRPNPAVAADSIRAINTINCSLNAAAR